MTISIPNFKKKAITKASQIVRQEVKKEATKTVDTKVNDALKLTGLVAGLVTVLCLITPAKHAKTTLGVVNNYYIYGGTNHFA